MKSYSQEVKDKRQLLNSLYDREVLFTPHPHPQNYRNSIDLSFLNGKLGFKLPQHYDKIQEITKSSLADPRINELIPHVREWITTNNITDDLRFVTIRVGKQSQIIFTTATNTHEQQIKECKVPADSIIWIQNTGKKDACAGDINWSKGPICIDMELSGKSFKSHPQSFFQASPFMVNLAIQKMKEFLPENATIIDLFCGVGVIGASLEPQHLIGVESNELAIELAKQNYPEGEFINADALSWSTVNKHVDVIIVDPPRTGLRETCLQLLASNTEWIFYLSCNPLSQRKDWTMLKRQYEIHHIQGFDFFPQTSHVESLLILQRK